MLIDNVLMFVVGTVFLGGGIIMAKQAFEDAKNFLEAVTFGVLGAALGLALCIWAIFGCPG